MTRPTPVLITCLDLVMPFSKAVLNAQNKKAEFNTSMVRFICDNASSEMHELLTPSAGNIFIDQVDALCDALIYTLDATARLLINDEITRIELDSWVDVLSSEIPFNYSEKASSIDSITAAELHVRVSRNHIALCLNETRCWSHAIENALLYLQMLYSMGVNPVDVVKIVTDANNRKISPDGTVTIIKNKVQKPEGYVGPENELHDYFNDLLIELK
ncbi:nucleoside triphosphate pyrophosphohydrolase family protein [Photobacterium leiognathi]|uniref:hypothetical protein n=1 Tax=Photobacterium leiognathi TaxID=553611 RepID=UPI002980CBFF|nr:hypothetical protein [Photobacterium leiognathi]